MVCQLFTAHVHKLELRMTAHSMDTWKWNAYGMKWNLHACHITGQYIYTIAQNCMMSCVYIMQRELSIP